VTGLFGAGKTVALRELGRRLGDRPEQGLVVDEMLHDSDRSIADVLIRGLARTLCEESEYAGMLKSELLGIADERSKSDRQTDSLEGGLPRFLKGSTEQENGASRTITFRKLPPDPIPIVRQLIYEAIERRPDRRLILIIDDLDKRDPDTVRQLLTGCRALIHDPQCSFVFTGHPFGVMRDAYSSAGGIVDREVAIPLMSEETMRMMVARYLGAGRVRKRLSLTQPEFKGVTVEAEDIAPFTDESLSHIISRSLGLPRVLNIICFNILLEAAEREFGAIGLTELKVCWDACQEQLRKGLHPDWRDTLELMSQRELPLDLQQIPDHVFDELGLERQEDLVQQLDGALKSDLLTTTDGRHVSLNVMLRRFDEGDEGSGVPVL
jgi:hypothetical protein